MSECVLWHGAKNSAGYGIKMTSRKLGYPRKQLTRHRLAYEKAKGPIPHGLHVRHACDVRNCENPDHLILGTHADNMRDKVERNRCHHPDGHKNGRAVLNDDAVREIRASFKGIFAKGQRKRLAEKYGVTGQTIYFVAKQKTWSVQP